MHSKLPKRLGGEVISHDGAAYDSYLWLTVSFWLAQVLESSNCKSLLHAFGYNWPLFRSVSYPIGWQHFCNLFIVLGAILPFCIQASYQEAFGRLLRTIPDSPISPIIRLRGLCLCLSSYKSVTRPFLNRPTRLSSNQGLGGHHGHFWQIRLFLNVAIVDLFIFKQNKVDFNFSFWV